MLFVVVRAVCCLWLKALCYHCYYYVSKFSFLLWLFLVVVSVFCSSVFCYVLLLLVFKIIYVVCGSFVHSGR